MSVHYCAAEFGPLTGTRQAPRQRTVFVIGKLTKGHREYVCRVRNISESGVGIQHDAAIAVGDAVTIELRGLSQARAIVRWVEDAMAGLEFVEPMQFEQAPEEADGQALRSPRFAVDRRVTMRIDDILTEVRVENIALGGMRVAVGNLEVGSAAMIGLDGHESLLAGSICWTSHVASGVQFNRPLATQDLIAILRSSAQ